MSSKREKGFPEEPAIGKGGGLPDFFQGIHNAPVNSDSVECFRKEVESSLKTEDSTYKKFAYYLIPQFFEKEILKRVLAVEVVDQNRQQRLEKAKIINWWLGVKNRLIALHTTGDGNCLLHAVSMSIWGFDDTKLVLRRLLYKYMQSDDAKDGLQRRWRYFYLSVHKTFDLRLDEHEWFCEWSGIIATADDKKNGSIYKSLEDVHIFALANLLQRVIICFADVDEYTGRAVSPFNAVFLPLLHPAQNCIKEPLFISYDSGHFTSLVPINGSDDKTSNDVAIPLVDSEGSFLSVPFAMDPGNNFDWQSGYISDIPKKSPILWNNSLLNYIATSNQPLAAQDVIVHEESQSIVCASLNLEVNDIAATLNKNYDLYLETVAVVVSKKYYRAEKLKSSKTKFNLDEDPSTSSSHSVKSVKSTVSESSVSSRRYLVAHRSRKEHHTVDEKVVEKTETKFDASEKQINEPSVQDSDLRSVLACMYATLEAFSILKNPNFGRIIREFIIRLEDLETNSYQ